jgi:hypothetical protein
MNARSLRILLSSLLLALFALQAGAAAPPPSGKKLYRWVDKNGQVHYGDSVPAEYADQDRDVLNRQGVSVGREEGIITAEEARAKAAEEKAARDEQKRKVRDRVLLQTYQSVRRPSRCPKTCRPTSRVPPTTSRRRRRTCRSGGTSARASASASRRTSSATRNCARSCRASRQLRPELPNPPAPRALASKSATTSNSTCTTGTTIICAMRSPGATVNG